MSSSPKLFQPIKVGNMILKHRVALAPLTRFRSTKNGHVSILPLVKPYYEQRASTPGTLLVTEATPIAAKAGGYENIPGIWNQEQIDAWKQVTDAVHSQGSFIFLQLWALGRTANPHVLDHELSLSLKGVSPIPLSDRPTPIPQPLTVAEIHELHDLYAQAAKNAIEAGFDGVELHGANGYLVDQFIQDVSNHRDDEYGGSIENRSRFALEALAKITEAIGAERTAFRLSPWGTYQDMGMKDPIPQYTHLVTAVRSNHPNLAYIHLVEPENHESQSNDFIRNIWAPRPLISANGYDRESALKVAEEKGDIVAFGRHFIANPDLPLRLQHNIPLNPYDRTTFYTPGEAANAAVGYIDYPFANIPKPVSSVTSNLDAVREKHETLKTAEITVQA